MRVGHIVVQVDVGLVDWVGEIPVEQAREQFRLDCGRKEGWYQA